MDQDTVGHGQTEDIGVEIGPVALVAGIGALVHLEDIAV